MINRSIAEHRINGYDYCSEQMARAVVDQPEGWLFESGPNWTQAVWIDINTL